MIKRKIYKKMLDWKKHSHNKALLITGARQVGKTYIIQKFAEKNWENFVEINFLENEEAREAVKRSKNSKDLFLRISAFANAPLIPNKTIIFLDEIQEAKEVITAIKFLLQRGNYDYILSGSMLGVEIKDIKSAPVGFLNTLTMYPCDFEEFCIASGVDLTVINEAKNAYLETRKVDEFVNIKLFELMHQYLICGGMPDPAKTFIAKQNVSETRIAQEAIVDQYRYDISKYAKNRGRIVKRIFDMSVSEISKPNKRFIAKNIEGDSHIDRYQNDFTWLIDANVVLPAYNVAEPRYPLNLSIKYNNFKFYQSDTGLLTYQCGMNVVRDILANRPDINFGSIYENFVAQELKCHKNNLYFYNKRNIGEIDFLIEQDNTVVPIEVKSGKNYRRHSSLDSVLNIQNYNINKAYVLHEGNVAADGKIVYLPVYMSMFM